MTQSSSSDTKRYDLFKWLIAAILAGIVLLLLLQNRFAKQPATLEPTATAVAVAPVAESTAAPLDAIVPTMSTPVLAEDGALRLSGTASPSAKLDILANGVSIGSTAVGADGNWSFEKKLAPDDYNLAVRTVDANGKIINESPVVAFTVAAPTPEAAALLPLLQEPTFAEDGTLKLAGTAVPSTTLDIIANDASLGQTVADAAGAWSFENKLEPGDYNVVVRTLDASGAKLNESKPLTVNVPQPAAATPQFSQPEVAADGSLTLAGSAQPGATLDVLANGNSLGTAVADAAGAWTFASQLGPGDYNLVVRTLDTSGAAVNETAPVAVSVAAQPTATPVPPTPTPVLQLTPEPAPVTPPVEPVIYPPQVADNGSFTVSGTAQPGATLDIAASGNRLDTFTADANGQWSYSGQLSPGQYDLVVHTLDASGNIVNLGGPVIVTVPGSSAGSGNAGSGPAPEGEAYIVQQGDWLSRIALRVYGDVNAYRKIIAATNLKSAEDSSFPYINDANEVEVGYKLWLPVATWNP